MARATKPVRTKVAPKRPAARKPAQKPRAKPSVAQRLEEALAQQAATAEILRVMASSPTDVQPVLQAVAQRAAELCNSPFARVFLADGNLMRPVAHYSVGGEYGIPVHTMPLRRTSVTGHAVLDGKTIHHADVVPLLNAVYPDARENVMKAGIRAVLAVPLAGKSGVYGAIVLWRREAGLFAPDQVALVETFSRQAAIAIENVRQFHATQEALEQQTATSEILRVISSSPTDARPVFDTIAASALRLCDAVFSVVYRFDGELIHIEALHNLAAAGVEAFRGIYPCRPERGGGTQRCILTGSIVHIPDVLEDPEYVYRDAARKAEYRSVLSVPMLRDGQPIGAIAVFRVAPQPFPDAQVELLTTFADQAVIAVENVRLFTELEARNADLTEALEQQTATSDILSAISQSQTDAQPVFDTIAAHALKLCNAGSVTVTKFDGKLLHLVAIAVADPRGEGAVRELFPRPPSRETTASRALLTGSIVMIPDVVDDPDFAQKANAVAGGFRSTLAVPLIRGGQPIGVITVGRPDPGHFPDTQVALLQSFADQAVIAIENVRLFSELESRNRELGESLEQQTATGEILRVISRSPTDVQPVFDAIAANATQLCGATDAIIRRVDGDMAILVAHHGVLPGIGVGDRMPLDRGSVMGRAVVDRRTVHIDDLAAQPDHEFPVGRDLAKRFGYRTVMATPLLREGVPIGAIGLRRLEVHPFSDKQVKLLETFADQAVIAIENVRLFKELKERNADLTEALEQQTATSEILRVISRSQIDAQPVFEAIAAAALNLCRANLANVFTYDGEMIHLAAVANTKVDPEYLAAIQKAFPRPPGRDTCAGRAVLTRTVVAIPNVTEDREYRISAQTLSGGFHSVLGVPLMRDGTAIGTIVVGRLESGSFADDQVALLKTFADQAVIAIENVRLFKELEARNADLTEALEQKTATGEILRVISQSQTDVQPVFDTIVAAARNLCNATSANVFTFDGELVHLAALVNVNAEYVEAMHQYYPRPPSRDTAVMRAILTSSVVAITDTVEDLSYAAELRSIAGGFRSVLAVPLIRDGTPIGGIAVGRPEPGPFPDEQIALLQTFADQAVIAIENVRLFKELEARTADLTQSVSELKALGEVGHAVSSTLDLATVLSTIVSRATQLAGMDGGSIYEYDEAREEFYLHTAYRLHDELVAALRAVPIRKGEGALGRMAVTGEPVQVRDILDEHKYQSRVRKTLIRTGHRALLTIPLLREDHLLGGLVVYRNSAGEFSPQVIDLLKTFATQSALAIQNARLFREIEDKSRQLEVASQHKSEFLANMSHELRTPLNAIIGFSEVLAERMFGEVNDKQAEYLADILDSGRHLLALINDILDLSKIEAGRMELNLSEFDLPTAIDNTMTLLRERAHRREITLERTLDERLGKMHADERKVKQVLLNLLSNALKFTPEGGRIDVRARMFDSSAEISVTDTGVGIAPEDQATVFEEFRQVGASSKKVEGTGLGLAISRKFIELHGGRIWVESEVGKGSRFAFTVPLKTELPA